MRLLPGFGKGKIGIPPPLSMDKSSSSNGQNNNTSKNSGSTNLNSVPSGSLVDIRQEWCELRKEDITDITSDTEYSMKNPKM